MAKQPHIGVDETQVAPLVIVCGEPDRANRIAALFDDAEMVSENREYACLPATTKVRLFLYAAQASAHHR